MNQKKKEKKQVVTIITFMGMQLQSKKKPPADNKIKAYFAGNKKYGKGWDRIFKKFSQN